MPMNTTLDTRCGQSCWARTTCSTISPVSRCRSRPAWPVAQNVQPIAQPACDDTHTVARCAVRMSTVSTSVPSRRARQSHFDVRPSAAVAATATSRASGSASASRSRSARGSAVMASRGRRAS